jgi:hypothetical protein
MPHPRERLWCWSISPLRPRLYVRGRERKSTRRCLHLLPWTACGGSVAGTAAPSVFSEPPQQHQPPQQQERGCPQERSKTDDNVSQTLYLGCQLAEFIMECLASPEPPAIVEQRLQRNGFAGTWNNFVAQRDEARIFLIQFGQFVDDSLETGVSSARTYIPVPARAGRAAGTPREAARHPPVPAMVAFIDQRRGVAPRHRLQFHTLSFSPALLWKTRLGCGFTHL